MKYTFAFTLVCCLLLTACSRKQHPEKGMATPATTDTVATAPVAKKAVKPVRKKAPVAKVIAVNDLSAKKAIDGRMYYDVEGYRYWRNYDDGKYYLFNKNMFKDPAFKPH